jgi:hypothetical protein
VAPVGKKKWYKQSSQLANRSRYVCSKPQTVFIDKNTANQGAIKKDGAVSDPGYLSSYIRIYEGL